MALVGNLKDLNIATLVQLNCVEKNTVELTVSTPKGPATIYFSNGEIVDAAFSGERGQDTVYRILALTEGQFRVTPITELPERTIFSSWEGLLLEGMRVIDETERGKTKIAESFGKELDATPDVECYVIASKKGEVIDTNRADDAERFAAAAALLALKGQQVSSRMGAGEMSCSTLLAEKVLTLFMDCGAVVVAVAVKKSSLSPALYAVMDDMRRRLKYYKLTQAQEEA